MVHPFHKHICGIFSLSLLQLNLIISISFQQCFNQRNNLSCWKIFIYLYKFNEFPIYFSSSSAHQESVKRWKKIQDSIISLHTLFLVSFKIVQQIQDKKKEKIFLYWKTQYLYKIWLEKIYYINSNLVIFFSLYFVCT